MRLLAATTILALVIAATASVFAIWPVVADAPWESDTTSDVRNEVRCEAALRLREVATEALAAPVQGSDRYGREITAGMTQKQLEDIRAQLARAKREIDRYC